MRFLLDTVTFLWLIADSPRLPERVRAEFSDPSNDVFLSSVSTWEIAVKHDLGRLPLPETPERFIPSMREAHGIETLPLDEAATLQLPKLPAIHRDPFDRMLICQAINHGLTLLTPDENIRRYPVLSRW